MNNISKISTKSRREFMIGVSGFVIIGCSTATVGDISSEDLTSEDGLGVSKNVTSEGLIYANQYREKGGVKGLSASAPCQAAAIRHALTMAMAGVMDHNVSGYGDVGMVAKRLRMYGVPRPHAENVSYGFQNVQRAIDMWYQSPGHRQNLMNRSYHHFGMAGATHSNSGGRTYWCSVYSA